MRSTLLAIFISLCIGSLNLLSEEAQKEMSKIGTVTTINLDKATFTIERTTDKRAFTFIVSEVKVALAKIKVGQIVEVTYTKDDKGDRYASKIVVTGKPAVQAAPAAPGQSADAAKPREKEDDLDISAPKDPSKGK